MIEIIFNTNSLYFEEKKHKKQAWFRFTMGMYSTDVTMYSTDVTMYSTDVIISTLHTI